VPALREAGAPEFSKFAVHLGKGNCTAFYVYDAPAILREQADFASGRVYGDPVSKTVMSGTSHYGQNIDIVAPPDALQKMLHLPPLELELVMVRDMLIVASAAMRKVNARRYDSFRCRENYCVEPGAIEAFSVVDDCCLDLFAVDCEWYENNLPLETADPFPAKRYVVN
jgi:hypothetical protein